MFDSWHWKDFFGFIPHQNASFSQKRPQNETETKEWKHDNHFKHISFFSKRKKNIEIHESKQVFWANRILGFQFKIALLYILDGRYLEINKRFCLLHFVKKEMRR